jgi:hypothetical protein
MVDLSQKLANAVATDGDGRSVDGRRFRKRAGEFRRWMEVVSS